MLSSITPLGERGRGQPYVLTVTAFIVGALVGGAALGFGLGVIGSLGPDLAWAPRLAALGVLVAVCVAVDLSPRVDALPGPQRQVNERWLDHYRGWLYGVWFGLQLGTGVATVVVAAGVWATLGAALLSGSPSVGMLIGATFGLVRGLAVLPGRAATTPTALEHLDRRIAELERSVGRRTLGLDIAVVLAAVALAGCGAPSDAAPVTARPDDAPSSPPERETSAPPQTGGDTRQLLFALPKLGQLHGDCDSGSRFRLTYRAGPLVNERVRVTSGRALSRRRNLPPREPLAFTVPVTGRGESTTTPLIRLDVFATRQPFEVRGTLRVRLAPSTDGTGECVALRAIARVTTEFHE